MTGDAGISSTGLCVLKMAHQQEAEDIFWVWQTVCLHEIQQLLGSCDLCGTLAAMIPWQADFLISELLMDSYILHPEAQVSQIVLVARLILQFSGAPFQYRHQLSLMAASLEGGLCPLYVPGKSDSWRQVKGITSYRPSGFVVTRNIFVGLTA